MIETKKQLDKSFTSYCDFFLKTRGVEIVNFIWTITLWNEVMGHVYRKESCRLMCKDWTSNWSDYSMFYSLWLVIEEGRLHITEIL